MVVETGVEESATLSRSPSNTEREEKERREEHPDQKKQEHYQKEKRKVDKMSVVLHVTQKYFYMHTLTHVT